MTEVQSAHRIAAVPQFPEDINDYVVQLGSLKAPDGGALETIVDRYHEHGVVIFETEDISEGAEVSMRMADLLQLGSPFSPPLYKNAGHTPTGVSIMSVADATRTVRHPSFHTTAGQHLHSDGTLQDIGQIKTSLLYCSQNAEDGGETFFLNSAGIFAELLENDVAAATALQRPEILKRISNVGESADIGTGPAFEIADGEIISRFSLSSTDYWNIPDTTEGLAAVRGLEQLIRHRVDGGSHFLQTVFQPGQGALFANDKVSHGRLSFTNAPGRVRSVSRALFERRPSVS